MKLHWVTQVTRLPEIPVTRARACARTYGSYPDARHLRHHDLTAVDAAAREASGSVISTVGDR
jgi:hypothetical protein